MPSAHLRCGNAMSSGDRVVKVSRQVYVSWRYWAAEARVRARGLPMNMRKPYGTYASQCTWNEVKGLVGRGRKGRRGQRGRYGLESIDF
jgi:hypothetical protein